MYAGNSPTRFSAPCHLHASLPRLAMAPTYEIGPACLRGLPAHWRHLCLCLPYFLCLHYLRGGLRALPALSPPPALHSALPALSPPPALHSALVDPTPHACVRA